MTLADMRARLRRGFARMWAIVLRVVLRRKQPGWGSEAASPAHEFYRTQYERMVDLLPGLPRKPDNETNGVFLAFSQVVQQLHEMGDDPINPPGISRVVRPEEPLSAFGPVGVMSKPAGFVGSLAGGMSGWVLVGAVGVGLSGWLVAGVQGARLDATESRLAAKSEDYALIARQNEALRSTNADLSQMVTAADTQTRQTAETIESERARRLRAEAELRRVRNAYEQARDGGPVEYGFGRVRDAGPAD